MADVDMLIMPGDREQVARLLDKRGQQRHQRRRSQILYVIDGVLFEMHWWLLTPTRFRHAMESKALLASKHAVDLPEGRIHRLSDTDELLGVVAHAFAHHDLRGMPQIVDIALIMARGSVDWPYVADWCRERRLGGIYGFTLWFVNWLLQLGVETQLGPLGPPPTARMLRAFEAYKLRAFWCDSVSAYLRRKRNLLSVTETPMAKLRQFVRFFAIDEARELAGIMQGRITT